MTPEWLYNGEPLIEPPEGYIGFVYVVTLPDERKYIGKKLWNFKKVKTLKGKRKHYTVESDWKTYFGSSEEVKTLVAEAGPENFKREIIHLCKTKSELNYMETWEIFKNHALLDDKYVNGWVSCRINKKNLKNVDSSRFLDSLEVADDFSGGPSRIID